MLGLLLPKRRRHANKGDYGHVLVIGGDYGMGGAVRMAAEAALRVGAGLVSVATRPEHVGVVTTCRPEIMCHQIHVPEDLDSLLQRATVLVIGPGLGKSEWSRKLFNHLINFNLPKVIDADGLNLLAEAPQKQTQWILTPHPGEAARLLKITVSEIQQDRQKAVKSLQKNYGGVAILKGAGTLVQNGLLNQAIHCSAGNPGMASGGMGDVLSGVIGGLLAQKLDLTQAAEIGVQIHSQAADQAAAQGGERGLLACDLLPYLRLLVNPDSDYFISDEETMLNFGGKLAEVCHHGTIIFLKGPLGAGKTTLVRGLLKSLGYSGPIKSPTYTLVECYEIQNKKIFHFDLYRLNHSQELLDIGFEDYLQADGVCLIEWPEKALDILPGATLCCTIEIPPNGIGRNICIEEGEN